MPLTSKTGETMKLAAVPLAEIEEIRPGVFRHRRSLAARIDRLRARWAERWAALNPQTRRPRA